jgi:ring-1,2-phenylacetyl-CoA epoxidase subunit PaaE
MPVATSSHIAVLQSVTPETPAIHTLRLEVPFKFKPGQLVQVHFPGEAKKRFYSISSSPTEGPSIAITVKSEAGSTLRNAISGLKQGDLVTLDGPHKSSLTLPDTVQDPLAFIAAGTGVTPFRSMIRFLVDEGASADFYLLHSVRSRSELLFHEEFMVWAGQQKRFRYVPTITRDHDATWNHETGRITDSLIRKHITAKDTIYYLCGPTAFVTDMEKTLLLKLDVQADRIRREKW